MATKSKLLKDWEVSLNECLRQPFMPCILYIMSKSYEDNISLLESLMLERWASKDTSRAYSNPQYFDVAIATVARYTPLDTIFDILKKEKDLEDVEGELLDVLVEVSEVWLDVSSIVLSTRNLLLVDTKQLTAWEDRYSKALSRYLVQNGKIVDLQPNHFGWEDFCFPQNSDIVAILSTYTEGWSEFEDTYCELSEHVGVGGIAVFSNGQVRKLRAEGEFSEVIRSITNS